MQSFQMVGSGGKLKNRRQTIATWDNWLLTANGTEDWKVTIQKPVLDSYWIEYGQGPFFMELTFPGSGKWISEVTILGKNPLILRGTNQITVME